MNIITRLTYKFIEIKVDEISTTIFKEDRDEVVQMIESLLNAAEQLANLIETPLSDYWKDK